MGRPSDYSKELRERAVRMVLEHLERYDSQWAAICSIAEKVGCSAEVLRKWVRQAERDAGQRPGSSSQTATGPSQGARTPRAARLFLAPQIAAVPSGSPALT